MQETGPKPPPGGRRGIILSYHRIVPVAFDPWGMRVSPEAFAEQLRALREIGDPMPLAQYLATRDGDCNPRPAIVVTFDDGYLDNLRTALPLLRAHEVPATVFISTGYTGAPFFWWEALDHVFMRPNDLPPELEIGSGGGRRRWVLGAAAAYSAGQYAADCRESVWRGTEGSRMRLYHEVYETLWRMKHGERLQAVAALLAWSGINPSWPADDRPMTGDELREMAGDPLVTIGGHSVNHLPLSELPIAEQQAEVAGGQRWLGTLLACPVTQFAYPHGKYGSATTGLLRGLGITAACTTREAAMTPASDALLLPRCTIKDWGRDEFRARLATWLGPL